MRNINLGKIMYLLKKYLPKIVILIVIIYVINLFFNKTTEGLSTPEKIASLRRDRDKILMSASFLPLTERQSLEIALNGILNGPGTFDDKTNVLRTNGNGMIDRIKNQMNDKNKMCGSRSSQQLCGTSPLECNWNSTTSKCGYP